VVRARASRGAIDSICSMTTVTEFGIERFEESFKGDLGRGPAPRDLQASGGNRPDGRQDDLSSPRSLKVRIEVALVQVDQCSQHVDRIHRDTSGNLPVVGRPPGSLVEQICRRPKNRKVALAPYAPLSHM
jgi:hypothetical protein